jgi:hypothetical protein
MEQKLTHWYGKCLAIWNEFLKINESLRKNIKRREKEEIVSKARMEYSPNEGDFGDFLKNKLKILPHIVGFALQQETLSFLEDATRKLQAIEFDFSKEEVKKWLKAKKRELTEISFADGLKSGRLVVRTFNQTNITHDELLNSWSAEGKLKLDAVKKRLEGKERTALSFSVLPSIIFGYGKDCERIGIAFPVMKQEDMAFYHTITDKKFLEKHSQFKEISAEIKATLTRISYMGNDDLLSRFQKEEKKVIPAISPDKIKYSKLYASFFQERDFQKISSNEALVKIRKQPKMWIFAPSLEKIAEIKSEIANIFKGWAKVEYAVINQHLDGKLKQVIHVESGESFEYNAKGGNYTKSVEKNPFTAPERVYFSGLNSYYIKNITTEVRHRPKQDPLQGLQR